MLGIPVGVLVVIAAAVVIGAAVQGLVGLGLNLVSAPVITMVEPSLMPELPLALAVVLPALTLAQSREGIDWRGLAWILPGRVPGTVLGVLLLALFTDRALGVAVGLMVLVAVGLSVRAVEVPISRTTLALAGFVSGAAGTTTSIGGPPVALLYQHRPPQQLRSTLAVFFTVGALLSLVGIAVGGRLDQHALVAALLLSPMLVVGTVLGVRLRGVLPDGVTRYAVLALCASAALLLLVRSAF